MATLESLTDRQLQVYKYIRELIHNRGYGPTVREIKDHFEISSPNGVMCHLKALEKKGVITREAKRSRAIELNAAIEEQSRGLPFVGRVAAGPTTLAFEQADRLDLGELFTNKDMFVLQVTGDSMIEAQIADGDFVVLKKQKQANKGQMVVALTEEGEATLKYWHPEANRIRLQPANRTMQPIYVANAQVLGVVVGVVRKLK
jgi:repressor LexA